VCKLCLATSEEEYSAARKLFAEYAASLEIDLKFQRFEEELQVLESMYALPDGGIILAKEDEQFIGCVAIRKIDNTTGELKRMYLKPAYQNRGLGKRLLVNALELAKTCKYKTVRLDTLSGMLPAIALYKSAGFKEIAPYYFNPNPEAVYFEKNL
jgi:putative acetyltransferase